MKVGVEILRDAEYLLNDYHVTVTNTLDLRFMAEVANCTPGGLAQMAANYVNLKLDKDNIRIHYAWESRRFSQHQTKYASADVFAGMLLFKYFAYKMQQSIVMDEDTCLRIKFLCKKYIDQSFGNQSKKNTKIKRN